MRAAIFLIDDCFQCSGSYGFVGGTDTVEKISVLIAHIQSVEYCVIYVCVHGSFGKFNFLSCMIAFSV